MNIGLKQISVLLLLLTGVAGAFARPGGNRWEDRDFTRSLPLHTQRVAVERGERRNEARVQGQIEGRRDREFGSPENSANGNRANNASGNSLEASRKQGKMSPEERRALRRQIDEAGHDIYAPKR